MTTIIDYGLGNLASIGNALNRLGIRYRISADPTVLRAAKALILPGVGAAGQGMKNLTQRGLTDVIIDEVKAGKPFLGICLGMQLLFSFSEEGNVDCLGLITGQVKKFTNGLKVPQIGWNQVQYQKSKIKNQKLKIKKLFAGIPDNSYFYFINSFYCQPEDESIIAGTTEYGQEFCSMMVKDNIIATQFHPEKSGEVGQKLLQNIMYYFCEGSTLANLS